MKTTLTRRQFATLAILAGCTAVAPCGIALAEGSDEEVVTIENFDQTLTFPSVPEKVVALTLNSAEILAALGVADRLTGIAQGNNLVEDVLPEYYDALKDVPLPDEVNLGIPTLEGLLSLEPELVVANSYYFNVPQIFGTMEDYAANGVTFYIPEGSYVPDCTIENTYADVRNLGAIFRVDEQAEKLVEGMRARIEKVEAIVGDLEPVSVMAFDSVDEEAFSVAGGIGLVNDLIQRAGGENAFADLEEQYARVGIEEIIARAPEVIIVHAYTAESKSDGQEKIDFLKGIEELSDVPAIKNDRIIAIPLIAAFPGLQNADYVEVLAEALYPESFASASEQAEDSQAADGLAANSQTADGQAATGK